MGASVRSELSSLLRGIKPRKKRAAQAATASALVSATHDDAHAPAPRVGGAGSVQGKERKQAKAAKVKILGDGLSGTSKAGVDTFGGLADHKALKIPAWLARGAQLCTNEGERLSGLGDNAEGIVGDVGLTEIQRHAIPVAIEGRDLLAVAPTGSGKTLAFLVPSVALSVRAKKAERSKALKAGRGSSLGTSDADGEPTTPVRGGGKGSKGPYAVLVSPTRELASQTYRELRRLLLKTPKKKRLNVQLLTNSNTRGPQEGDKVDGSEKAKRISADIVVSTPPRLAHAISEGAVKLSRARMLVLDEADKLFSDDTFLENIDAVMSSCTHKRLRRCIYTATLPETAEEMLRNVMRQPVRITVGERNAANSLVKQSLIFCGVEGDKGSAKGKGKKESGSTYISGKLAAIRQLVASGKLIPPVLVFVQSKDRATQLYEALRFDGMNIDVIHAGRTAKERARAVQNFRSGSTWILITTDLMARGMDILGVNTVVNFDCPGVRSDYVHRVGRTGRAGHEGNCFTLYTEEDFGSLHMIASCMKTSGNEAPEWMLKIPRKHGGQAKKYVPPKRKDIITDAKATAAKRRKTGKKK